MSQKETAEIFEYLFPGSKFDTLPKFDPLNVPQLLWGLDSTRRFNVAISILDGNDFAERDELRHPDRLILSIKLRGLSPLIEPVGDTHFWGRNFADPKILKVDNGEKLNMAAVRTARPQNFIGMETPFFDEIIISVVDKNNKPTALVWFSEANSERKVRKKEEQEPRLIKNPHLVPVC